MNDSKDKIQELQKIVHDTIFEKISDQSAYYAGFFEDLSANKVDDSIPVPDFFDDNQIEIQKQFLYAAIAQKSKAIAMVDKYFNQDNHDTFKSEERLKEFDEAIESWLSNFPLQHKEFQNKDRFTRFEQDPLWVKSLKKVKAISFKVTTLPLRTSNWVRLKLKRQAKPIQYWRHTIPEQALHRWYYKFQSAVEFIGVFEQVDKAILELLNAKVKIQDDHDFAIIRSYLKTIDNPVPQEPLVAEEEQALNAAEPDESLTSTELVSNSKVIETRKINIDDINEKIKSEVNSILEDVDAEFNRARLKVGTLELPAIRFRKSRLKSRQNKIKSTYKKITHGWVNAHYVVREDWKLNLELYKAIYAVLLHKVELVTKLSSKTTHLITRLGELEQFHENIKSGVSVKFKSSNELKLYLKEAKVNCKKDYKFRKARALSEDLINQNFPALIDRLESSVRKTIQDLPAKSNVVKELIVESPVDDNSIFSISPAELVFFESFGDLEKSFKKGKLEVLKKSGEAQAAIESLGDVLAFSIDAALDMLEKDANLEEVVDLVVESMDRATTKVAEIAEDINEIGTSIKNTTTASLRVFNNDLANLTDNENVYQLRYRLTKAKAVAATSALKTKAFQKIASGTGRVASKGLQIAKKWQDVILKLSNRFNKKINTGPITTEVSNFLADSENKIQQLPYVYQRLFSAEPVVDRNRFIGRTTELKMLELAYSKWDQGKYAATLVLGEKGGGLTSLINYFLLTKKINYPVLRIVPSERLYDKPDLLKFLSEVFGEKMSSVEAVIEYLNEFEDKQVVILEDLQKFYLRRVGGFNCINLLRQIITETNDNVFWVVSTTLYTWEYLHKAIRIGEYFEYQINLTDLDVAQITEVIQSRNRISGYTIEFEVPDNEKGNKKLEQLTYDEIQDIWSNKYFSNLNKFTRGNVALSLLYFQLSVTTVSEDTISIKWFTYPDLSFISSFDKTKVFVLQACILHDGVTSQELSQILNINQNDSLLLLLSLFEDGIMMKRSSSFVVNPLIYRQTVNLLKSKNLLL